MALGELIAAVLGGGVVSAIVTAWATLRGKETDTETARHMKRAELLNLGEEAFRARLIERIEQLERADERKSKRIMDLESGRETDRLRILELEGENRLLRIELNTLRDRASG